MTSRAGADNPSALIDQRITDLGDWRGDMLARARQLIRAAVPDVVETWKWRGVPVWEHDGILCTGETYRDVVKLTFAKGAALPDPAGLFNASLDGNTRRAIDLREGDRLPANAFKTLVRAAAAANAGARGSRAASPTRARREPVLLSGGNPQIAKGDGDGPVQAYIAAMPGWKRDVGRRLDELIVRAVPKVRKAVKWNSPFYGVDGRGWFVSYHCFTKYVKVTFFRGASLDPVPPVGSKDPDARYFHVFEGDEIDERQFVGWCRQAAKLPGWVTGDIRG